MSGLLCGCPLPASGDKRCQFCHSVRTISHPEITELTLAHLDCDAFFAAIEKRDNPELANKPVIVGGGKRGVVAAACYIARLYGVKSAMPMFKALKCCPEAVVITPRPAVYRQVGAQIRALMQTLTPLVEPLSIDEAFLDLAGTEKLHGVAPAARLAKLVAEIDTATGLSVSVGLSYNKFLAKIASDLDKPQGFSIIGRQQAQTFLADKSPSILYGVGKKLHANLRQQGIFNLGQLRNFTETELIARFGPIGKQLWQFSHGIDERQVNPHSPVKSFSNETTFAEDIQSFEMLRKTLWALSEKLSARMKRHNYYGRVVTLKLKTSGFRTLTRRQTLPDYTQLADKIFQTSVMLLAKETGTLYFRLMGVGVSDLAKDTGESGYDLADPASKKRADIEKTMDQIRAKIGPTMIKKGRSL